ncbi:MAG: peptidylprolyl isomerase [Maribacter sp.]
MKKAYLLFLGLSIALVSCKSGKYPDLEDGVYADIQTTKGDIVVKLEYEKTPVTVANFISLAEGTNTFVSEEFKGKKFYDGLVFHRVMKDFMIQGGCPQGTGMGNPGYRFMDEFNDSLVHDKKGILSMANSGPASNGSQFFITHGAPAHLNNVHSIFGEVISGMPVLDTIANVPVGQRNKPVEEVKMNTIEIIRNGKDAKKFDAVAVMTDYFSKEGERLAAAEAEKQAKIEAVNKVREAFAANLNDQKAKAKELPSGLKILTLNTTGGEKPRIGQNIGVLYAGYFEDGNLFDTNYEDVAVKYNKFDDRRKQAGMYNAMPLVLSPDMPMIHGFKEGLMNMNIGDKVRIFIPSHLGYGEQGKRPIPPNTDLVFDLEITGIAQ